MGDPVTMAMTGAALNGGLSLVRGKGLGSALENAAIGGALGYGGGTLGQAMGIGSGAAATSGALAKDAATGEVLASSVPGTTGVSAFTGAAPEIGAGASSVPGTTGASAFTQPTGFMDLMKKYGTVDNLAGAAKIYGSMPQNKQGVPPQSNASVIKASQLAESPLAGLLSASNSMADYKKPHFTLLG